jgi:hypothetical protein
MTSSASVSFSRIRSDATVASTGALTAVAERARDESRGLRPDAAAPPSAEPLPVVGASAARDVRFADASAGRAYAERAAAGAPLGASERTSSPRRCGTRPATSPVLVPRARIDAVEARRGMWLERATTRETVGSEKRIFTTRHRSPVEQQATDR